MLIYEDTKMCDSLTVPYFTVYVGVGLLSLTLLLIESSSSIASTPIAYTKKKLKFRYWTLETSTVAAIIVMGTYNMKPMQLERIL